MKYCSNCGAEVTETAKFCENCGAPVDAFQEEPVREQPAETYAPATPKNTAEQESLAKSALTFSIIGLVLAELGLPGIILSAIAKGKVKKATAAGAVGGKLKTARILSNIGLIVSIVMTVIWLIYILVFGAVIAYGISEGAFDSIESSFSSF